MKHRSLPVSLTAAVAGLAVVAAAAVPAAAAPPPDLPGGSAVERGAGLEPTDKVAPSLAAARGTVTAFVQLDAPSGVDLAAQGASPREVEDNAAEVATLADDVVPQQATARSAGARNPQQVSVTSTLVSGVVVTGDADRVRDLARDDKVVTVYRIIPKERTNKGTDLFTRAAETWQSTGLTGEGVRIGIIDTGIDYTHADFGGPGTQEAYDEAYGERGDGPVPEGTYDELKFLGGHDFAGYDYDASGTVEGTTLVPTPDENPIDSLDTIGSGHGSHVAGTAAGYGVTADGSTFDGDYSTLTDIADWKVGPGSAPEAGVYALKVFGDLGGSTGVVVDALEWAADPDQDGDLSDRLDIVNLSLGSAGSPADDPETLFIDQLSRLGTLSVNSAGNSGDVTDIGGSPGNSRTALTVANSVGNTQTFDAVEVVEPAELAGTYAAQNSVEYRGEEDVTAPVAFVADDFAGCQPYTAEQAAAVAGKIAFLSWDDDDATRECGSAARFNNAEAAGALGVLLSSELQSFVAGIAGNQNIPGAQLTGPSHAALRPAIEAGTVVLTIGPSYAMASFVEIPEIADTLNSGSSRGVHGSLGVVKPDVAAPGTGIASAASGRLDGAGIKSGTSMSAPHVTGIAALVKQAQPGWGPQEIKTSVMNTATHDVFTGTSGTGVAYGPERVGSGRVDALQAVGNTTLAYASQASDLVSVAFGVVDVGATTVTKRQAVTVRNTGDAAVTYATAFTPSSTAGGASVSVTPATITVPAGQQTVVTVTLTADPATLTKALDPTSSADSGLGVPRDFVSSVSGRVVLTPTDGGSELRVPVQASPRLVSDLTAKPVTFGAQADTAELDLDGRGFVSADEKSFSLLAPFELKATSPRLEADASEGTSATAIASTDIRAVGFSSTAPQLEAAGKDPSTGYVGIGIAVDGQWATLGSAAVPAVEVDVDSDGSADFEVVGEKYFDETDLTLAVTYTLKDIPVPGGKPIAAGTALDLLPVNLLWGDVDSSVFDNNVVVLPMSIETLGLEPGDEPTFQVRTYSPYSSSVDGLVDATDTFTGDPYDPAYWFEGDDELLYVGADDAPLTVHRSEAAAEKGSGKLLLLHLHNATPGKRWQTVDVTTSDAAVDVTVTAEARCLAGKAYVAVRVLNESGARADIAVTTPYGDRTFNNVKEGKNAYQSFPVRDTSVEAGSVTVDATAEIDGAEVTTSYDAAFEALSCS
ncbi:S8 family serine peptidase [Cellulosimicrobium sp. Marseille-Q8652]